MKRRNGSGTVYKMSGNRRNPWVARVTVGYDDRNYPKYKYIGYYGTRDAAERALLTYLAAPNEFSNITMAELYSAWRESYDPAVGESSKKAADASWQILTPLAGREVSTITLMEYEAIFKKSGKNAPTIKKCRTTLGQMYDYAIARELIPAARREIIRLINYKKYGNPNKIDRNPLPRALITEIWRDALDGNTAAVEAITLIYTGLRLIEWREMKKKDVHLEQNYMSVRRSKTAAGVRDVVFPNELLPIYRRKMESPGEYLNVREDDKAYSDSSFRRGLWDKYKRVSGYRPHDCRHTFITLLVEAGVDERLVRSMAGHKGGNVTDDVYTHLRLEEKVAAVNTIWTPHKDGLDMIIPCL